MEKELRLYKYVDGVADTPFPSLEEQAVLRTFTYSAKRMGGAPSIAGTIMCERCLDSLWSNKVYATFNGEKYFVRRTPSSSYSNTDSRYRHDVELISERAALDEVYFFDVVTVYSESDKPQSNNSNVVFFGDIFEFVSRLNKSLARSGLGYHVQVDAGVTSESKLVTLKDQFVTNALQEIPKLYNLKYYFDGKTIHVGDASLELVDTFQYGSTSALLSINKNNSNSRIVNRCSGLGGSKNIPYFYPNKSPYGDVAILLNGSSTDRATVFSWERFAKCGLSKTIVYKEIVQGGTEIKTYTRDNVTHTINHGENDRFEDIFTKWEVIPVKVSVYKGTLSGRFTKIKAVKDSNNEHSIAIRQNGSDFYTFSSVGTNPWSVDLDYGDYELVLKIPYDYGKWNSFDEATEFEATLTETKKNVRGWFVDGNEMLVDLSSLGITFIGTPANGDTISFELKHDRIPVSANLMPYIYRESMGEERFYNAVDGEIKVGDEVIGNYKFSNPYFEGDPREHIESFDDIYPTIEGITNASGQRVDEFVEFAYDEYDSDEKDENNNPTHPYFYAKLRKFDGANGFNLFTHAIESGAMSLSVKDGACGGCEWKIQIDENTNLNPVQVWEYDQYDENGVLQRKGTLKRDANGNVLRGAPQEMQNDATMNEVWVALRKDDSTFGVPMPNAKNNYKPSSGDKFVILNISLPQSYIEVAEKKLSKAVVDYMGKNNSERFNFGIKFSRIYLEENEDNVLKKLSENIRLRVSYDDRVIPLYASGFTYKMDALSPLPEVTVELEDNVSVLNDRLSVIVRPLYMQAIENAQKEVVSKVLAEPSFASTTKPNVFAQDATFNKNVRMDGVVSSSDYIEGLLGGQGWGIYKSLDGNTVFEVDEVVARKGFKTVEFVVNETKAQKGEYLITLGNCKVSHVDEYDTYYRCYYETHGNTDVSGFVVNDQAICRVYDESYANVNKYYWRLVVGVGFDYVDLSKLDFDGEGIPAQNDVLVQLGNREDVARQNAITITSAPTPSIIQYKGLSGYSITQDNIVTKISPEENILTGKVTMQSGSKGLENFDEWAEKQAQIDGFEYLREAMANDTTIEGGLIQSSLLRLGYKQNGEFVAMSGTSGLYDSDDAHGGIAAWYGGDMIDAENDPNSNRAAQALFRMDGTGYLAGGKITWDKNGSGSVAGGSLKWDKDGYITLANEIYLGDDEEETLGSILNKVSGIGSSLSDMFTVVESGGSKYIRANYDFFSIGGITAGGIGSSSGGGTGGGGSSTLSGLNDVALKSPISSDVLVYNGSHWTNTPMSSIKPDLTDYATKSWVEGKGYALNTALLAVDTRLANVETIFTADQDGAINKWSEVVAFLDGIEGDTLDSILAQFATKESLAGYLPLSGGSVEGDITLAKTARLKVNGGLIEINTTSGDFGVFLAADKNVGGTTKNLAIYDQNAWNKVLHSGNYTEYTYSKTDVDNKLATKLNMSGGTLTGLLTIPSDSLMIRGVEADGAPDRIVTQTYSNGLWGTKDAPERPLWSIRNAFAFDWYNDRWIIGAVRYGDSTSAGFGVGLIDTKDDGTLYQKNLFRIDKNGEIYQNGVALANKYVPRTGGTFSGNVTAPTFIGNLTGNADSASVLQPIGMTDANSAMNGFGWINPWATGVNAPQAGNLISLENGENSATQFLSAYHNDDLFYRAKIGADTWTDWEKIIHTGNLNDLSLARGAHLVNNVDFNDLKSGIYDNEIGNGSGNLNAPSGDHGFYGVLVALSAASPYNFAAQFHVHDSGNIQTRGCYANAWSPWKTIAFTDSNVASATKLQTPRTIWGQSFDGTSDVSGDMTIGVSGQAGTNSSLLNIDAIANVTDHPLGSLYGKMFSIGVKGKYGTHIWTQGDGNGFIQVGRSDGRAEAYHLCLQHLAGNVGIGTTAPSEKLHVNGSVRIGDAVLTWDSANGGLKVSHANGMSSAGFYATGYISAGGVGSGGSSGGGGASYNRLDAWADYTNDKSGWVLSALLGKDLDTRVNALANAGYITSAALDPYAKSADVANTYATKTALQGVDIRVQAIEYIFEEDQDGVINKWSEIVNFLAGVEGTTLDGILEQFATKDQLDTEIGKKANKATSFEGYGITGGTLTSQVVHYNAPFYIQRDSQPRLSFSIKNGANANLVYFGEDENKIPKFEFTNWGWTKGYEVLHAGNIANYTYSKEQVDTKLANYLPINGTAPNANTLNWASFTEASGIGFNLHQWFASGKVSDIPSMGYSTVWQAGLNRSRAWQIWVSRTDHATHTRHTDGTNWTEEYTLLDDHNYTNYTVPKTGGTFSGNVTAPTFIGNLNGTAASANTLNPIFIIDANAAGNGYSWINPYATGKNVPTAGNLISLDNGTNSATQLLSKYSDDTLYYRAKIGADTWTEWREVLHSGNYSSFALPIAGGSISGALSIGGGLTLTGDLTTSDGVRFMRVNADTSIMPLARFMVWPGNPYGLLMTVDGSTGTVAMQAKRDANEVELFNLALSPLGGNVGIGTTNPAEKLDVAGNIKTSGSVRIGDAILSWDAANKCITIKNANTGEKSSLFVDGGVTATAIN